MAAKNRRSRKIVSGLGSAENMLIFWSVFFSLYFFLFIMM